MLNIFKRKAKKKESNDKLSISLRNTSGETLYKGAVTDIVFPEPLIIEKSIEFFNDPDPCYIHRGAVNVRLAFELKAALSQCFEGSYILSAETISKSLPGYLDAYDGVVWINKEGDL